MKKLFLVVCAGAMLSACAHGPKKDEPLGLKAGMTIEDVRSRIQLVDEKPSIFFENETTAQADKIDVDAAQPKTPYLFFFEDGKLRTILANYSGKEDIGKVENYLNQVANCQHVDKKDDDIVYHCGYYNPERSNQQLASFVKIKSFTENGAPSLGVEYTFTE